MTAAEQIAAFFRRTDQRVFIEAEAREEKMMDFISAYNSRYSPCISLSDQGIICLDNSKNKWGLELRCYFGDSNGFPEVVQVTNNRAYRSEYPFRFNDVEIIWELFDLGYRIGIN